jgi:hypothetical protein
VLESRASATWNGWGQPRDSEHLKHLSVSAVVLQVSWRHVQRSLINRDLPSVISHKDLRFESEDGTVFHFTLEMPTVFGEYFQVIIGNSLTIF